VKIYTRKGDGGETGLFDGTRVPKSDPRVDAYGDVDELNSVLGAARAFAQEGEVKALLEGIQKDLLAVGAQLADPKYDPARRKEKTRISEERITEFERMMDRCETDLPPLKGFILPCGTAGGAFLHLARTVCRRAERKVVGVSRNVPIPPIAVKYLNRLSDLLFVLARVENKRGGEEQVDW